MASICVFCASSERIDLRYRDLASEVGRELARRGHDLVSGGGRVSAMGAVARAAREGGAYTVGVLPRGLADYELADEAAHELSLVADMRARKAEMDRRSDGFLALPGGIGTLEETLEIWVSRSLGLHAKPLVVLDPDRLFAALRDQVAELVRRGFVHPATLEAVTWTTSVSAAFDALESALSAPRRMIPHADEILSVTS